MERSNFPEITTPQQAYDASWNPTYTPTDLLAIAEEIFPAQAKSNQLDDMYICALVQFALTDRIDQIEALAKVFSPRVGSLKDFNGAIKDAIRLLERGIIFREGLTDSENQAIMSHNKWCDHDVAQALRKKFNV